MPEPIGTSALKYLLSTVTATPNETGLPSCTISTIGADRDMDHVIPEGMDATNFLRAPVLMWSHGGSDRYAALPIGTVTALNVTPGAGITAEWRWLEGDPMADRVRNAWDQGVVRGTSIGFRPKRMTPNAAGGVDHEEWELLELSVCPIPANPEAVRTLKAMGLMDEPEVKAVESDAVSVEPVLLYGADGMPVTQKLAPVEALQKRGRVLSAVNESRLRAALTSLSDVLAQLLPAVGEDEPVVEEVIEAPPAVPLVMALDPAETYSLDMAEDTLRLVLAEDPDEVVCTLIEDHEQRFAVNPADVRAAVIEAVRSHRVNLAEVFGVAVGKALDTARGIVR